MRNRIVFVFGVLVIYLAAAGCGSGNQPAPQPGPAPAPAQPSATAAPSTPVAPKPFDPLDYRVDWVSHQIPSETQAGRDYTITVTLKNTGSATWPAKGTDPGLVNKVFVAYHWLPAKGDKPVIFEGQRTPLPQDLGPGQTVTVNNVLVIAPGPGSYRLQITLVHEGVFWFEEQGAKTLIVPVTVS